MPFSLPPVKIEVRPFKPEDREPVRYVCCETGFLGKTIDPIFQDREVFADFLTSYYTDVEPDSAVVITANGDVKGYVLGCRHPDQYEEFKKKFFPKTALKMLFRYFVDYKKASRRYVHWLIFQGWKEISYTPQGMAHFHINVLPEYRKLSYSYPMFRLFLETMYRKGEKKIYGQMAAQGEKRGEQMVKRFGFEVIDKVEVTKYKDVQKEPTYLFTAIGDLEDIHYKISKMDNPENIDPRFT